MAALSIGGDAAMLRASSKGSAMRHRDFGLLICDPHRATPGLTLFSPLNGKATYIIGLRGDVLHQWAHPLVQHVATQADDVGRLAVQRREQRQAWCRSMLIANEKPKIAVTHDAAFRRRAEHGCIAGD